MMRQSKFAEERTIAILREHEVIDSRRRSQIWHQQRYILKVFSSRI
jgi:hypothetical protein